VVRASMTLEKIDNAVKNDKSLSDDELKKEREEL